jgi:hypothetical protein
MFLLVCDRVVIKPHEILVENKLIYFVVLMLSTIIIRPSSVNKICFSSHGRIANNFVKDLVMYLIFLTLEIHSYSVKDSWP